MTTSAASTTSESRVVGVSVSADGPPPGDPDELPVRRPTTASVRRAASRPRIGPLRSSPTRPRTALNNGPRWASRGLSRDGAGPFGAVGAAVNAPDGGDIEFALPVVVEGAPGWAGRSRR